MFSVPAGPLSIVRVMRLHIWNWSFRVCCGVYVTALDGRTLTVRYCRRGSILGAVSLFATSFSMPASVKAVIDAEILSMSVPAIRQAADRDLVLARALIDEFPLG